MMTEPGALTSAREHLSRAEADFRSDAGLRHLAEGLALLEEVALESRAEHRAIAANLLSVYSTRICESVKRIVASDRTLPEPELEHLFKVLLAFDSGDLELPEYVRTLKIEVVKRLIDLYYEGYSDEEKQKVFQQLEDLTNVD